MTMSDIATYLVLQWVIAPEAYVQARSSKGSGAWIKNILDSFAVKTSETRNGITYTWSGITGYTCRVNGTATSASYNNLYNGLIPADFKIGKKYSVKLDQTRETGHFHFRLLWYDKDNTFIQQDSDLYDFEFTVPENAFTVIVRLYVANGMAVDSTIRILRIVEAQNQKMDVPHIISFVDDDASGETYVTRYYQTMMRNGIRGNYAVITNYWDRGATDPDTLLAYEDDGMGMLMHCSEQSTSLAPEWDAKDYDKCRANMNKCIRAMTDAGFVNFRYWVTPSGVVDDGFRKIASDIGAKCLISSANWRYNRMCDSDKYRIKRCSFNPYTTGDDDPTRNGSMANVKAWIDGLMDMDSGWLLITTHYNNWDEYQIWDSTVDDTGYPIGYTRMNTLLQYAIASGASILTVPEAWHYFEPILDANKARENCIEH